MTIDLLHVNLDGCFAPGQAYVACSRGRSAESMVVEKFSEEKIITSDLVKQFYSSLKDNTEFRPPTWAVVLEDSKKESEIEKIMMSRYGQEKCRYPDCGYPDCEKSCKVYRVKNQGKNNGKWVVQCKLVYRNGHTWRLVEPPKV